MIVYDSSALIDILGDTERGKKIREKLGETEVVTTVMNAHEIMVGSRSTREWEIFRILLSKCTILTFDMSCVEKSARVEHELSRKGLKIGRPDMIIAGICIRHDATLITCDKDFERVEGLKLQVFS